MLKGMDSKFLKEIEETLLRHKPPPDK